MCGINGILGLEGLDRAEEVIGKMNDSISHRGPDADGLFKTDEILLGHRRLSIIDLNKASDQPFREQSGRYTIVYNGELYNFESIKAELSNYPFITNCDTEVVLAAYMKWGASCLNRFNGMFAFAIWDNVEKELFIARDRLGIKPLYYSFQNTSFIFSSEIRAILKSGLVPKKLSHHGLLDYLRYQTVHAPNTIVEGIHVLPAGNFLKIQDNEHEMVNYWDAGEFDSQSRLTANEVKANIQTLFQESVAKRTMADVPFGAFLSGGIDSSAVVGMMARASSVGIDTFSVTFAEEEFSEAKYARLIAKKFETNHHEIKLTPTDFLEQLPNALSAMDHPSGDGPNTYVVSKATKNAGVTMALSGLGGDELFAGYELFKRCHDLNNKRWVTSYPKVVRRTAAWGMNTFKSSVSSKKAAELLKMDALTLDYTYPLMRRVLLDDQIERLIKKDYENRNAVRSMSKEVAKVTQIPFLSRVSILEMGTYMQNVLLRDTDQMSMAHALEVRVPFLDHELVEFVLGISDDLKFPHTPKQLLIESLGDLLPDEIVNRPKMGFTLPWEHWMRNELFDLCDSSIKGLGESGLLAEHALNTLWNRFLDADKTVTFSRIWPLVVLQNWMKENEVEA